MIREDPRDADGGPKRRERHTLKKCRLSRAVVTEQKIQVRQAWFRNFHPGEIAV